MSKRTVTQLFTGSLIAFAAGAIIAVAAVWLAIANNVFVMAGADIVRVEGGGLAWSLLGLAILGGVAIVAAFVAGLVAWIGALLNTWQLESKAWFAALLLTGIFNFGFVAMIVYVIAGPDSRPAATSHGMGAAAPA